MDLFDPEEKFGIYIDSQVFTSVSEYPVLGVQNIFDIFLTEQDFRWFYLKSAKSS